MLLIAFLAEESSGFIFQLSFSNQTLLACIISTHSTPKFSRIQLFEAAATKIARLFFFIFFRPSIEHFQYDLRLGNEAIFLITFFHIEHLCQILLGMRQLFDAQYLLIDLFICEITETPLILVDHISIIKASKIWISINLPEGMKEVGEQNILIAFSDDSLCYLIDIFLIIRVNRNLQQIKMRRSGIQLESYNIFHPMKKTSKQQVPHPLSILKQPNIPNFAFTGVQQILRQQKMENKESRETIIVCPNCEFHFKVESKQSKYDHSNHSPQPSPKHYSQFIEEEYSLISNNNRDGKSIVNSPASLKKQNLDVVEILNSVELSGIDKLKKLNEFSEYQRSALKASRQLKTPRAFKESIQRYQQIHQSFDKTQSFRNFHQQEKVDKQIKKFTERFQSSPRDSPIRSHQQKYSPREDFSKISHHQNSGIKKQFSNAQRLQMQKIIANYLLLVSVFNNIRAWLAANQYLKNLPSYLKLLISQCQEITILLQK